MVLPTVVACSRALARFAINLDKNPHLIANVNRTSSEEGGDSIPERCANIIRGAFTECFKDRSGPPSGVTNGRPDGKRVGIYLLVNLCLRILFQCRKLEAAHIIFDQISQNSPPLDVYPKAQQITYLYYLGRFHFTTSHFYSAQAALNAALDLCPKSAYTPIECRHQRRLISIYLIASNIVVGRFPSVTLWARLDVDDLRPRFEPLYTAIRKGDLASFRRLTSIDSPEAPFFLRYRILLQLRNRCEVLVWRSILRRTFLLAGQAGDPENRRAPTLELSYVLQLLQWMEKRALMPITINDAGPGNRNTNWIFMENAQPAKQTRYIDPDFEDPDNPGKSILDEYNEDREDESGPLLPNMLEVEAICAALVNQGLLKGFVSHRLKRFAIQGARTKGALAAGWPRVWDVMREREREENPQGVVPGWKRETPAANGLGGAARFGGASAPGPGTVVRLTGARPVGVGP